MAKITYNPTDPADAFAPCTVFGVEFKPGETVDSDDTKLTPAQLVKLSNNGQFSYEDGPKSSRAKADA
jgi:hypothetical protein